MKKYHLFLPLLGILLLVSGGCSKRKEPKPLITEAPAVETEIGGYITETVTGENENSLTVCFARSCSLFTGTASAEKEAFPIYSKDQLYRQILDSICYTLQVNFSQDQDLSIYYCTVDKNGEKIPIELEDLGITVPSGEPYQHFPSF